MTHRFLPTPLRRALEKAVKAARDVAEEGAADAVRRLGVAEPTAPGHLSDDQKALRRRLRAHARTLGDTVSESSAHEVRHLIDHTGGRVTEKFLSRTGRTDLSPRDVFPLGDGYVTDNGPAFVQFVRGLDRALVKELDLVPVTRSELEQLWAEDTAVGD